MARSYAVGLLQDVRMGPAIIEYLERIDATLAPFDGHFVVHGGEAERCSRGRARER